MTSDASPLAILEAMFREVVVPKDAAAIPRYYDPDFLLQTNGGEMDYERFLAMHREVYATAISYRVEVDRDTVVEGPDGVAARVWITTARPGEEPREIQVVLIARMRDGRLWRLWELTSPDWTGLPAFREGGS